MMPALFAPYLLRIGLAVAATVALWFVYAQWRDALIERGVMKERAAWMAKNLEQTARNEKTRADRAQGALEESWRNADVTEKLSDAYRRIGLAQEARIGTLQRQVKMLDSDLFEPPREGDCRVYVKPAFIGAANLVAQ